MSVINITTYLVATLFDVKTKTFLAINSHLNIARSCFPKTLDVPIFDALRIEINICTEIKETSLFRNSMAEHSRQHIIQFDGRTFAFRFLYYALGNHHFDLISREIIQALIPRDG